MSTSCFCSPFLAIVNSEVFSSFFFQIHLDLVAAFDKKCLPNSLLLAAHDRPSCPIRLTLVPCDSAMQPNNPAPATKQPPCPRFCQYLSIRRASKTCSKNNRQSLKTTGVEISPLIKSMWKLIQKTGSLSRKDVNKVNVPKTCQQTTTSEINFRYKSACILGIHRIFQKKVFFALEDTRSIYSKGKTFLVWCCERLRQQRSCCSQGGVVAGRPSRASTNPFLLATSPQC